MAAKEIVLETPAGRFAGLEWGSESNPPILALHGWLDNAATFSKLGAYLQDFHLVAIDLPGHGKSVHRCPEAAYHFVDFVDDVLVAADTLGWSSFGLIGHSLGASIASILAGSFPERVSDLVLIDGIGPIANRAVDAPGQLRKAIAARRKKDNGKEPRVFVDMQSAVDARMRVGGLHSESAKTLVERALCKTDQGYRWRHDPRLMFPSPVYFTEPQVLGFLRSIISRTLLIKANGGIIDRFGSVERIVSVPNITVRELTGGHHLHLENPQPVALEILQFLANDVTTNAGEHLVPGCLTNN